MNDKEIGFYTDHDTTSKIVLSAYLGEHCKFCDKEYKTLDDLKDTVWAGPHDKGCLACKSCFQKAPNNCVPQRFDDRFR